uniref:Replication initiation protein n=1 Tax=Elaeophora elaphi TaxID=1147741 RepID=A0A0R3RKY3_9BILA
MANTGNADFPTIPIVTDEQLKHAEKHDILKTIGDILTGKVESSTGKNLTFHIDLEFRKSQPDELALSENSTTISAPTDSNSA